MEQREELLATVASLYYKMNQGQAEIASRLDVSVATISRYLKEARERGLVEFHIRMPIPRDLEMEQLFVKRFGLKDAYILQTSGEADSDSLLQGIGRLASVYLEHVIGSFPPGASIGVAWGTGVHAAVSALPDHYAQNIDVVQLLGGVGELVVDSPDLGRMVAQKLGGRHHDLHAPMLVERATSRDLFLQEPVVLEGIIRARGVRLAITGIGSVHDEASSFLRAGLFSRSDLSALRQAGAVGETCGRFYDLNGDSERFEINQRIIGIELSDLRAIPQSVAIARGLTKAPAILGALRGSFMRVLATDDLTARAVIELDDRETR